MRPSSLSILFGYDSATLTRVDEDTRRDLLHIAEAWLLSSVLLALPMAYAAWLLEHSLPLALLAGFGCWALVVNMLRLTLAGGGASPELSREQVRRYRPALGPVVVIGVLALLMAQPAQLPLWRAQLDAPVARHRDALLARHQASIAKLGLTDDGTYANELERCDFVVLRMQLMWREPGRAAQLTLAFMALVLLPGVWARLFALSALRDYELARWQERRRSIARDGHETRQLVHELLSAWPSYQGEREPWHVPRRRP